MFPLTCWSPGRNASSHISWATCLQLLLLPLTWSLLAFVPSIQLDCKDLLERQSLAKFWWNSHAMSRALLVLSFFCPWWHTLLGTRTVSKLVVSTHCVWDPALNALPAWTYLISQQLLLPYYREGTQEWDGWGIRLQGLQRDMVCKALTVRKWGPAFTTHHFPQPLKDARNHILVIPRLQRQRQWLPGQLVYLNSKFQASEITYLKNQGGWHTEE